MAEPMDYEMMQEELGEICRSPLVEKYILCHSMLGREIPLLSIGEGERSVLYVGAHHGMESITTGVLLDFLADFIKQYEKHGSVYEYRMDYLFRRRKIYIVPMLNPDGVEYAVHGVTRENPLYERLLAMNGGNTDFSGWQANARGVDLNHNYDAGFETYKKKEQAAGIYNGAPTRYSGEYPESEIETAALCRFLRGAVSHLNGVLTLHTQGEEIFCSCENKLAAKSLSVGRILQRYTGYELKYPEGLAAFGGLTDWCIEKLNCPSYTLECGKGKNPLPPEKRSAIYERLRRSLFCFPFLF